VLPGSLAEPDGPAVCLDAAPEEAHFFRLREHPSTLEASEQRH